MSKLDADPGWQERKREQRELNITSGEEKTRKLRFDEKPQWERLRQCLAKEGIAPADAVVCRKHDEDVKVEFGIIATRDDRAFTFELDFHRYPDGRDVPSYDDAWVSDWEELDERRRELYAGDLEVAREIFARENRADNDEGPPNLAGGPS